MRRTVVVAAVVLLAVIGIGVFLVLRPAEGSKPSQGFAERRLGMVERQIAARGVKDDGVLAAMRAVPRHEFVQPGDVDLAYADQPLPIGFGQTISQPYIVALMTELAQVRSGDKVLEIGTGSGYQAAVLAELTDRVYSIEIVPELARSAGARLRRLGYTWIRARSADGYFGWGEHAPFDAILVTAAPDHVPPPLIRQLKNGGHMVVPVGPPGSYQTLWRLSKKRGKVVAENITDVAFVPFTRR